MIKIHAKAEIDLDELFEGLMDVLTEIMEIEIKWHRAFIEMDDECEKRKKKDPTDDLWNEELYDKYSKLEEEVEKKVIAEIKRQIREDYE